MQDVIHRALEAMNQLIDEGETAAESHARVALAFHLTDEQAAKLMGAYDDGEPV